MSRILFIASRFPYPPFRGDIVRTLQQIRLLGAKFDITFVAPHPPVGVSLADAGIEGHCRFVAVRLAGWHRFLNLIAFFKDRLPVQTAAFYSVSYGRAVARALRLEHFDLVHLQMVRIAPVLDVVNGIPVVLDMIDTASLNMERRAAREALFLRGLVRWEARRLREYERMLAVRCARVVVSSPTDLEALNSPAHGRVVPFGLDLHRLPFTEDGREDNEIVFTGRMGYFPNADAAAYFAEEILPLVRQSVPEAHFSIVGIDPPSRVRALSGKPGVRVVPDSNLRMYLDRAALAVAPLRSGTGLQLKVLEAMASGAPVVATPIVAPAIAAEDGNDWFLAESPVDFAAKVELLLKNKATARRMARSARQFVEAKFAQDVVVGQMGAIWDEIIAAARDNPIARAPEYNVD
jgi:glycosyltransferase involved in cell wall biosynthesis